MNFTKTVGHEKQKRLFLRAWGNGRLAHAYALVGQEGIGKTAFAGELAQILGADQVLDMFMIGEDEGGVSAQQARSLHAKLSLTPAGKCKVAIIKADGLTEEAANSLLKILEEPPGHSYIFLTTANFYSLLPTIASRVQKIQFTRLLDEEMAGVFTEDILGLAQGRFGFAKRLTEDAEFLEFVRGCDARYQILEQGKFTERLQTAEKIAALETPEIIFFLRYSLERQASNLNIPALARKIYTAVSDLQYNVNVKLAMDNLFLPL